MTGPYRFDDKWDAERRSANAIVSDAEGNHLCEIVVARGVNLMSDQFAGALCGMLNAAPADESLHETLSRLAEGKLV